MSIVESDSLALSTSGWLASTYYISEANGNDSNSGTSEAKAWKTTAPLMAKLQETGLFNKFREGSVVLFERGGTYRNVQLKDLPENVQLGAYGIGEKPQLYGGDKDYADVSYWQSEGGYVWSADVSGAVANCANNASTTQNPEDIGNIVFDSGVKVASSGKKLTLDELAQDYDFYYNADNNRVYVYLTAGNPASVHSSIEMSPNTELLRIETNNHKIDNLCFKYASEGIMAINVSGIEITNCEFGYIGGGLLAVSGGTTRHGNGITLFNTISDCKVENNWIYQCFDAGYSHQSQQGAQSNITISNNLIEYCLYSIEMWSDTGDTPESMTDITISNNVMRFAGYGFGTYGRKNYNTSTVWVSHISLNYNTSTCVNTVITGNVFDCSYRSLVHILNPNTDGKPSISGNTWIQQNYSEYGNNLKDPLGTTAVVGRGTDALTSGDVILYGCANQTEMEVSVAMFDTNPTAVVLDN